MKIDNDQRQSLLNMAKLIGDEDASITQIAGLFPKEWEKVSKSATPLISTRNHQRIKEHLHVSQNNANLWTRKIIKSQHNPKVIKSALPHLAKSKLTKLAYQEYIDAAKTNNFALQTDFSFKDKFILKHFIKLPFLRVTPVRMWKFNFWWRFIHNKNLVINSLKSKGVYSLYSKDFVDGVARLLQSRDTHEIAAGDGTLTKFLKKSGANIAASDNNSWTHVVNFGSGVRNLDASEALSIYRPKVVICAWPPPQNGFEKNVFKTPEVETYILITSRHDYATGDTKAYAEQEDFAYRINTDLSKLLIPQEVEAAVVVFNRRTKA